MIGKKVFLEGNAHFVGDYFEQILEKNNVKIAYFGQNIKQDLYATFEFNEKLEENRSKMVWDALAIVEEFSFED
jgi:hypothetical protein